MVTLNQNHFELFNLPSQFALDAKALDESYRAVQAEVHPDRFAAAGNAQKRIAMQWATRVNEAYRTLKNPLARAGYVLHLRGIDVGAEDNTAMEPAFLMQQIEWREQIEDAAHARNAGELERLLDALRAERQVRLSKLGASLDSHADQSAAEAVRQLMFIERLESEVDTQLERLESA